MSHVVGEAFDEDTFCAHLKTAILGRPLVVRESVTSTQDVAREHALAAASSPDGAVVLAEFQTAGRCRLGRSWSSPPYVNLLFSHDHEAARIVSFIPRKGRLMIDVKDTIDLYVRVPPWVDRKSLCVTIDGASVNVVMAGNYLNVGKRVVGSCVSMSFAQPAFATQEHALGYEQPYRVKWIGSTVAAMSGGREPMPLYPDLVCN